MFVVQETQGGDGGEHRVLAHVLRVRGAGAERGFAGCRGGRTRARARAAPGARCRLLQTATARAGRAP